MGGTEGRPDKTERDPTDACTDFMSVMHKQMNGDTNKYISHTKIRSFR